jgi:hypothetical protein
LDESAESISSNASIKDRVALLPSLEISVPATTATAIVSSATSTAARLAGIKPVLPRLRRTGFVDCQRAIIERVAIKLANGFISLLVGLHSYEPKPARLPREFVLNDLNVDNAPDLPKQILQVELGRGEG